MIKTVYFKGDKGECCGWDARFGKVFYDVKMLEGDKKGECLMIDKKDLETQKGD